MKDSKLLLIRHWKANYENLKIDEKWVFNVNWFLEKFKFVKDLKEDTVSELQKNFKTFIKKNLEELKIKNIHLWISPFARTTQTAYIFLENLNKYGIKTDKINLFSHIQEAKNFSWDIFNWLVEWKTVKINNKKIKFDKKNTNPQNLSYAEYFFQSYWTKIPNKYLQWLNVFGRISSIETYENIVERSQKSINRVLSLNNDNNLVIMFSHQCFSDHLIKKQENYKNGGQKEWEILIIKKNGYERY